MKKLFMSDDELRFVVLLERQMVKSMENLRKTGDIEKETVYIENLQKLNDIKYEMLNDGKVTKGLDMNTVLNSVLGFVSVKQLLAFETTGVITSKVFPTIVKWIGK